MNITGPVDVKINGRYAITVTGFNKKKSQATKQHVGSFGVFGTSQSAGKMVSGSFKVSIPEAGLEFDFDKEFGGAGGRIECANKSKRWKRAFTAVKLAEDDLAVDEVQGNTEVTINWTAEKEVPL
jgi:hypothetical protein